MERALVFVVVYLVLFLFGVGYNALVGYLERNELDQGYTAFLVVFGVLVTVLVGGFLAGLPAMLIYLSLFGASGLAMIAGAMLRHAQGQKREREYIKRMTREVLNAEAQNWRVPDEAGSGAGRERE